MKVWVFVEGVADQMGLETLWSDWRVRLRDAGWGIAVIPLNSKANFLRKFGARAAEKLIAEPRDLVVGMPDLHPTVPFQRTAFAHDDAASLKRLQVDAVRAAVEQIYPAYSDGIDTLLERTFASVFRHDFEMLLLAAVDALRAHLRTSDRLGNWRKPVEDQNLHKPPKRVVEELFLTKSRRRHAYRDTKDAPAVLRKVKDLRHMMRMNDGAWTCPEFVTVLKWMGRQTGVSVCELD